MTTVKKSRDKKKTNIDPIILFAVFIVAALVFGILFYCTLPYISENYHQKLINKYLVSDVYETAVQKASSSILNSRRQMTKVHRERTSSQRCQRSRVSRVSAPMR